MAAILAAVSVACAAVDRKQASDQAALDQAFRFATAIQSDAVDRASAQERVVLEYGTAGSLDAAMRLADKIDGWQRGVAYAELAAMLAKSGRAEDARAMIRKAEDFRETVTGWENPRIAAHVANALAALGAVEASEAATEKLAEDRQYGGRAPATLAAAQAAKGDFAKAMATLAPLGDLKAPEDCTWRAQGYLAIARQTKFSKSRRLEALSAARQSAEAVAGWLKIEPMLEVADEYSALGKEATARQILEQMEKLALEVPPTAPLAAPDLSAIARSWGKSGKPERARSLLARAEKVAVETPDIGRPYIIANVAAGYHVLGDATASRRLLALAFNEAQGQVNARPRALSVVEICRTMARFGMPLDDATRSTLDSLYDGLKEPW